MAIGHGKTMTRKNAFTFATGDPVLSKAGRGVLFGTEDQAKSTIIPTLDPSQTRVMNSLHELVNSRIGQNEYSHFAPFFKQYGDVEGVARARINNAYSPQGMNTLFSTVTQPRMGSNIDPRLRDIYQGQGMDSYLDEGRTTFDQNLVSQRAEGDFLSSEARRAALFQQMQQTPQQMEQMAALEAKLSDPTESKAFKLAQEMLGIKTFDRYNYTQAGRKGLVNQILKM